MAGGQLLTSARGAVTYGLTVALVGLAITTGQGTVVPTGANAAALSGAALTSAHGTLTQAPSSALTGTLIQGAQGGLVARGRSLVATSTGTMAPDAQIPLTGHTLTGSQGTVTAGLPNAPQLLGQALTSAQQSLTASLSQALTGSAGTSASGTLTPRNTPLTHTGQLLTSADGTLVAAGPTSVTVHISGVECTAEQGAVDSTPALTGEGLASGHGTLSPAEAVALTGHAITVLQGAATVEQNPDDLFIQSRQGTAAFTMAVPLVGEALTGAQGTITLTDGEQGLTGHAITSDTGTVINVVSCDLIGEALTADQYPMGAPGFADLTGQAITVEQETLYTSGDRAAALTGSEMTGAIGALVASLRQAMTTTLLAGGTGLLNPTGSTVTRALSGQRAAFTQGALGMTGQDVPTPQTPSLEGCGITSGVSQESVASQKTASSEGCFVTAHSANEVA